LDNGETFVKGGKYYKRYKFQVNKGADDKTLKKLADKDSHKVWAEADMPIGEEDQHTVVENLFADLEKDLKKIGQWWKDRKFRAANLSVCYNSSNQGIGRSKICLLSGQFTGIRE
jgi:hypothetical protein